MGNAVPGYYNIHANTNANTFNLQAATDPFRLAMRNLIGSHSELSSKLEPCYHIPARSPRRV